MKYFVIIICELLILTSCTYYPKEKRLTKFRDNNGTIRKSFYKKANDSIVFKRFLINELELTIQSGQIFIGKDALTHQRFTAKQKLHCYNEKKMIDSLTSEFTSEQFVSKMTNDRDVMFIQIVPDSAMGNIDVLRFNNLRQKIESEIDEILQRRNLGKWFAGDMGAGANMLFFIDNWNEAIGVVIQTLKEENLIEHVLITKRIMTSANDWNYEIVYPLEYEGIFNSM